MGKTFQTVARLGFIKSLLIVFNLIFWLSGLVILFLGIWMEFQLYKYIEFSNDFFSIVRIVVMGLGGIIIILATLACCFTAKGIVPLLYIYSSLLMVIFCIQVLVFVIGYIYRDKLSSGFHDGLGRGLDNYGKDTALTQAIDGIQTTLHCCGLSNYSDWSGTPWGTGHRGKLPHSCCLYTEEAVCAPDRDTAFIHRQGCYRIVVDFFMDNLSKVGIGILSVAGFHFLGVLLSCCLAKMIHQAQYEEIREMTTLTTTNHPSTSVSHYYVSPPQAAPAEMEVVLPPPPPPAQQATNKLPSITKHHSNPGTQYPNKNWEMTVLHQSEPSPQTRNIPTLQSSSSLSHSSPPQPPPKLTTQVQINHPVDKAYQTELLHRVQARNPPSSFNQQIQHHPGRTEAGSQWSLGDHDDFEDPDNEIEDEEEDYGECRSLHRKHSFDGLDY